MIRFLFQPSRGGEKARLWSARIRLDEWPRAKTFPLHVTDRRVAEEKMRALVSDLERETHGIGIPKATREALRTPLLEHHSSFIAASTAAKLSTNSLNKYRHSLPLLFKRCNWETVRDITAASFLSWREQCKLSPKTVNDCLGSMRTFLGWMKRRKLLLVDPLESVEKVKNPGVGSFRRSLSVEEARQLVAKAPTHRATVYLTMMYTGLRRNELAGLKWGDFDFAQSPARLRVPSSLSKNRHESVHYLRPEVVQAVLALRPADLRPENLVFRGLVPRIPTFKRDLAAAGIPFQDVRGRRVDLHALRKTYGTMLAMTGVAPRVAMELMRHSDMKLTMGVYTDATQLPLLEAANRLPSMSLPDKSLAAGQAGAPDGGNDAQIDAQRSAQAGVAGSPAVAAADSPSLEYKPSNPLASGALGHEKAPRVTPGRFS